MEIRDPVHGSIEFMPKEIAVLESPAFQRLRSIKQLGFGEYSYPGGTHSRFLHSIGVGHLAGIAFDHIFHGYPFQKEETRWRLRQTVKLAAMLHDIGHGPMSHASEEVMPPVSDLKIKAYEGSEHNRDRQATHEDYTIKFITDSHLSEIIRREFPDIDPVSVASLIDKRIAPQSDFFKDNDIDLQKILSQLVSSELDVDRMDYLLRDSHFCGINYGKVEMEWITSNLTYYKVKNRLHLALGRRALYTFDDFLVSRHHMYLMVYFHHKALIYDEMLHRYLTSDECTFRLPADINEYLDCDDYSLQQHLRQSENDWAKRIAEKKPFKMAYEFHATKETDKVEKLKIALENADIKIIHSSSVARLSKYHPSSPEHEGQEIFVVDPYNPHEPPVSLAKSTEIFQRYEDSRRIERIYVEPEKINEAKRIAFELKA